MDRNLNYTIRVNLVDQASNSADGVNRRLQQMAESAQQAAPRFNQLNMSIQQVARELPAFSYSISTGFMAISNNLPMLADAIQQIRRENEDLRASGQKTVPVWKQVAKSLLSWNTALSVGITLLTVYGSQIAEGISKMQLFKKAIDPTVEANKQLNEAIKKGTEEAQKELTQLNVLYGAATDDTRRRKERLDAVKQLQDQYPAYFKNLSDESIMAGQAADAYARLTKSLTDVAMPVQPMLIVSYAIKPGVIYDKPFYTFTRTLNVSVSTTDGRSDAAPSSSTFNVDNSGDELTQHLQQLASKADTLRLEELE